MQITDSPVQLDRISINPTRGGCAWVLSLDRRTSVQGAIYDVAGRRVAELVDGTLAIGTHRLSWNGRTAEGRSVPAGVYFVRVDSSDFTLTDEVVLIR